MKILATIIVLGFFSVPGIFIKEKCFSGYIFNEKYFVMMDVGSGYDRYTPTKEDIIKAEDIIKKNIKTANKSLINQIGSNPIIHKKLNNYVRQYVGFINEKREKIIWVNFVWKNQYMKSDLEKEVIFHSDGGSYFWNVTVDIEKNSLCDLEVNGNS